MEITFEFNVGDIVCYKVPDDRYSVQYVTYKILGRQYEELTTGLNPGDGIISYSVRGMNSATFGSGDLYRFREDELILYDTLKSLRLLKEGVQDTYNYDYPKETISSTGGITSTLSNRKIYT